MKAEQIPKKLLSDGLITKTELMIDDENVKTIG